MIGPRAAGEAMHAFVAELYPECRSITGNGLRRTLARIGQEIPLTMHEVPTGTPVLDWTVPREWNIRDAYVADAQGNRVIDFRKHSLHVVNYSTPVRARVTRAELLPHLHSLPDHPEWIPYRTSYYDESWGFCLSHRALQALPEGEYDVVIDATLAPGALTYAECILPGKEPDEVLISAHACHPSLANDNLSGLAVATWLARAMSARPRRLTYRFVFAPGTIGAITWLSRHREAAERVVAGLVLAGVGDPGPFHYKASRQDTARIDRVMMAMLAARRAPHHRLPFTPLGYDERQYGSPGFNLPVGRLTRTPHGAYPEYHTSADDLRLVTPAALEGSLDLLIGALELLDADRTWRNTQPHGEPHLGKRGLAGPETSRDEVDAMLWILNLSDGRHSLVDIVQRSALPPGVLMAAAARLEGAGLLHEA